MKRKKRTMAKKFFFALSQMLQHLSDKKYKKKSW